MIGRVTTRTAEELNAHLRTSFPGRPAGDGGEPQVNGRWPVVEHVDDERIRLRQRAGDGDLRPGATVSGPTLFTLVDTAAWLLTLARLAPDRDAVTSSVSIQFLRRPPAGDLVAEGRLLRIGRRLSVTDVLVHTDGDERPVVQATVSYAPV
jgi:uncharacterized protein (TIGR00369 family)